MHKTLASLALSVLVSVPVVGSAGAMDSMKRMSASDCMTKAHMVKDAAKMAAMAKDCHSMGAMKASGGMMKGHDSMMRGHDTMMKKATGQ